jgi:hypothetical protein
MVRLLRHPLCTSLALILALCVSAGIVVLLLSQSQSAPQAAEIKAPSAHTGELPELW